MTKKHILEVSLSQELASLKYTSTEDAMNKFDKLLSKEDKDSYIYAIDFNNKTVFVIDRD